MTSDPHAPTPAGPDPDEATLPVSSADATPEPPALAGTAEDDWLTPDPALVATPAPDPIISTPDAFTPPGTPETGDSPVAAAQAKAQELTDRPEVMVGLAFVGGAVVSLLLKRLRR